MPKIITPMLAELGKGKPPEGGDWLYEIKWDGVRAICFIEGGKLRMISRNGNAIDKQYPELSILPHQLRARSAIVDGEIAALDGQGRPSFELLQSRMHVADAARSRGWRAVIRWCSTLSICCIWTGAICGRCR